MSDLTEEEQQELKVFFDGFDKDGSGKLGLKEFSELIATLRTTLDEEGVRQGFEKVDTNNDGQIGFEEFIEWWGST